MKTQRQAIIEFLNTQECKLDLYTPGMEVQVNVISGEKVENKRSRSIIWTDGQHEWSSFRIPYNSRGKDGEPHYKDSIIQWPFNKYVQAIGLTGWDWDNRVSRWVGFDFDAIASGHARGLTSQELNAIRRKVQGVPWVTLRRSKSGKGYHIYVNFKDPVPTDNHTEHAALARAILSQLSGLLDFDFDSKVDCVGGVLWVWHKDGYPANKSFTTIQQGEPLDNIPPDWHNFVTYKHKAVPSKLSEDKSRFNELQQSLRRTELDDTHRELLTWFANENVTWWWDSDLNALVCHTFDLARAHKELKYKGVFLTNATGKESGNDHNCFCFPTRDGSWNCYRFGLQTTEHKYWQSSPSGWTYAAFNSIPNLHVAASLCNAIKTRKGSQQFKCLEDARRALSYLEARIQFPQVWADRPAIIEAGKDEGELVVILERKDDDSNPPGGWYAASGVKGSPGPKWELVVQTTVEIKVVEAPDNLLRHAVEQHDSSWYLNTRDRWIRKDRSEVTDVLKSIGYEHKEVPNMLGQAILDHWDIVAIPFGKEYPGNREWNLKGCQLAFKPSPGAFSTWEIVLTHIGKNIYTLDDEWCQINNVTNGAQYLMYWIASLFQHPYEPLPYLFCFGEQDTGKSILHESLSILFKDSKGYPLRS
jgi:hypothetical protein